MRILITAPSLNPSLNVNGITTVVQTIIQHNKSQHYIHYLLGRPDKKQNKFVWMAQLIKQLAGFPISLKRNKIELVHQNFPFNKKGVLREFIINMWCRMLHIPVLLHVHGGDFLMKGAPSKFYTLISKMLLNHSQLVVVLSELETDSLSENYQYTTSKVLNNSIDSHQFGELKKIKNKKNTFLFLGRIHESKGVEDIISAFKLLKNEFDFRFILCGIGPLQEMFVKECQELLGNDFEYLGIVSGAEKLKTIGRSDYFLLPSRYGEGLPMALLETMASGIVPVVTDDASMKFVVQQQYNGIRVKKSDPQDIYEKMKIVLLNASLYNTLSENAVKTIKDHFDINNYIVQLNKLYELTTNKK